MATTQRVIHKSLAGAEDLLNGVGVVQQSRGGQSYGIHKLDVPVPVSSIEEMQTLDVEFARVYNNDLEYTDYRQVSVGSWVRTASAEKRDAMARQAADAGYNLVAGSFEEGGSLVNAKDVLWYIAGNTYLNWFDGAAKTVMAGATPATSGGVGAGAWVDRSGNSLRQDLNIVVKTFNSVSEMIADPLLVVGQIVRTNSYRIGSGFGGNTYQIVPAATGIADGGSYISLTASGMQAKGLFSDGNTTISRFGAVGDGVADDSQALTNLAKAFNYILIDLPVRVPSGYISGLNKTVTSIGGFIKNSPLVIDVENASNLTVRDLRVEYDSVTTGQHGLVFKTSAASSMCRDVTINNLHVINADYCIYIEANSVYTMHCIGLWKISNCKLFGNTPVKYSAELLAGNSYAINDHMYANNITYANINTFDMVSVDGLVLTGNTLFPTAGNKSHFILGTVSQLVITGNNIFECDNQCMVISALAHGSIVGNNIVNPCRVKLANAIDITLFGSNAKLQISANVVQGGFVSFIKIASSSPTSECFGNIGGNSVLFLNGTREAVDLATQDRFIVKIGDDILYNKITASGNSGFTDQASGDAVPVGVYPLKIASRKGDITTKSITLDASGSAYLIPSIELPTRLGKLNIYAYYQTHGDANSAIYSVNTGNIASGYFYEITSSSGMDTSVSASWPAFNFSRDATGLKITHQGGTAASGKVFFFVVELE